MWLMDWILSWWRWFFPVVIKYPYEFKYPLSSSVDETEENKKLKRVEEMTPEGHVYMTFDEPSHTFFYWSDRSILYKYLDVVARKYVIVYDCKDVYVNLFKEIIHTSMKEKKEVQDDIYVKLKTVQKRYKPSKDKVNQYKYLGKWKEPEPVPQYKKASYLDYKHKLYE